MMHPDDGGLTRRGLLALAPALACSGLTAGSALAVERQAGQAPRPADEPFGYCLNTSTIRGHQLTLAREVELASEAGYHALEPWISELDAHVKAGGSLYDLGRQIRDHHLSIESAIGFFEWAVDDDAKRRKALDEARRNMEMVRAVGGTRLAAPPVGLTARSDVSPQRLADRYRALLELGAKVGVLPQLEVWGFSRTLGTLGEAAHVAIASDHPDACILADVYHLYKGGSGFHGVRLLSTNALHVVHMNDYPASPGRAQINDADRVYPGDGVAPLGDLLRDLNALGFRGFLSIELFNRKYWEQDAPIVLKTALDKLRGVVRRSLAEKSVKSG